jgi:hypothetical protein
MNGSATNPLSVSPRRGSPPLPLKGARKGADRGEFMPFLQPFSGGGVEGAARDGEGAFNTGLSVATPRFRSGHCQRTLPVGSSREAGRWVSAS